MCQELNFTGKSRYLGDLSGLAREIHPRAGLPATLVMWCDALGAHREVGVGEVENPISLFYTNLPHYRRTTYLESSAENSGY
jgi:hypothetical protein